MGATLAELLANGWQLVEDQTFVPGPDDGPADPDHLYDPED